MSAVAGNALRYQAENRPDLAKKEEAKVEDGAPKRKPPTLYRPGEKPAQP